MALYGIYGSHTTEGAHYFTEAIESCCWKQRQVLTTQQEGSA